MKKPGTYSQIYVHVVFAVKNRQNLLQSPWRTEVFKYMSAILEAKGHQPIVVNGVSDHVHLFFSLSPEAALSGLVRDLKINTTRFIRTRQFVDGPFSWQQGYGAFTYSRSQFDRVCHYIRNQEEHHRNDTFQEEYRTLLVKFGIPYDQNYLFEASEKGD